MKNDTTNYMFGIRAVIEAINSNKIIDKILIKKGLQGDLYHELMDTIKHTDITCQYVPIEKLNRVTRKNHQGVIAFISPIEFTKVEDLIPYIFERGNNPLLMILDKISDTRNFGAIARSAECGGVDGIIIPSRGAAQITAEAIKTSAGALHTIPVCKVQSLKETMNYLNNSGIQIVAATEKGTKNYFEIDYNKPTAILMGSEDKGISDELIRIADELAKIPIKGKIKSLNVSVASSIFIFEAIKQRDTN